ncbi:hypothetical protein R50076_04680 [Gilvimarinus japonicus]
MNIDFEKQFPTIIKIKRWLASLGASDRMSLISTVIAVLAFTEARITSGEMAELTKSISSHERDKALYESRVEIASYMREVSCLIETANVSLSSEQISMLKVFNIELDNRFNDYKVFNGNYFSDPKYDYDVAAVRYGNHRLDRYIHIHQIIRNLKSQVPVEQLTHVNNVCSI